MCCVIIPLSAKSRLCWIGALPEASPFSPSRGSVKYVYHLSCSLITSPKCVSVSLLLEPFFTPNLCPKVRSDFNQELGPLPGSWGVCEKQCKLSLCSKKERCAKPILESLESQILRLLRKRIIMLGTSEKTSLENCEFLRYRKKQVRLP